MISDSHLLFLILARVQSQVDEVIDVMQENISKVIERGERLDDLQDKSGESHKDSVCFDFSQMRSTQTLEGSSISQFNVPFLHDGLHMDLMIVALTLCRRIWAFCCVRGNHFSVLMWVN